ncbi:MAG: MlaD family protein [Sandaracinaceae bacterium]
MNNGSSELRVGIFVTAALLIGGVFVFVIGGQSALFSSKTSFHAEFADVEGLRPGSPIRIGGIEVGSVQSVTFVDGGRVDVELGIEEDAARFVREGSAVSIGSKGLLGDQLIDVSIGEGGPLREGATLPVVEESLLTTFLGDTGTDVEGVVSDVRTTTTGLATVMGDEQTQADLRAIVHNLEAITRLITENDGTVRRLLTDPSMADDVQGALTGLRETSTELNRTVRSVRRIVNEVERGDGTAHEILYGDAGVTLLASLATAASEIAQLLRDVRTGDNNAHELLYGDEAGGLITNLTAASGDLRAIVADVRAGRGTIGGLLVDPSIYEDVKRLVGNLQRNEILRSLVRYSIREDGQVDPRPRPEAEAGAAESEAPPAEDAP